MTLKERWIAAAHGGEHRGDAGTDVFTEGDEHGRVGSDQAVDRQRLQDTDGDRRALEQRSDHRAGQDAEDRIVAQSRKDNGEDRRVRVGLDRAAHGLQAEEQKADTDDDLGDVLLLVRFREHDDERADAYQERRVELRIQERRGIAQLAQGHDPCGDGGTDVGTHDHAHCLGQRHQAGTDKTDYHDRSGAGALDDRSDQRADPDRHEAVPGQHAEEILHLVSGRFLHAVRHHVHAVEEHSEAADEHK